MRILYNFDQIIYWNVLSSHNNTETDTVVSRKKEKPKILDNTRIPRLRDRSDKLKIIACLLVVSGVIVFAGYSKLVTTSKRNEIEHLTHFDILNDDKRHYKITGTDVASAQYADDFTEQHTINALTPLSYIWYVAPKISSSVYNSIINIKVKCIHKTSIISFHLSSRLKIVNVAIKAIDKRETIDIDVLDYSNNKTKSIVLFKLNTELITGHLYNIYIGFDGQLATQGNGMLLQKYVDGNNNERQMVSATFQPGRATNLFPYVDDATHKASFQIILLHNRNFSAVSNMPIEKITTAKQDMVETHFTKSSTTTSEFLFIIFEYTYEVIPAINMEVRLHVPEGRGDDASAAKKMIQSFLLYYQKMFAIQLNLPKLDFVTMQSMGIYTSPGLFVLPESLFLSNKQTKTLEQIETSAQILAQGLMKQLFGCMVTMESWNDEWFRESLALYIGFELVKYHYPSWDMTTQFYLDITNKALVEDASYFTEPIIPSIGQDVYPGDMKRHALKGAALFDMISQYVGRWTFHKAITTFCVNNQHEKNGEAYLQKFINILAKNITQDDIVDKINSWFTLPGFPLITIHHQVGTNDQYVCHQDRFVQGKKDATTHSWWIPISARSTCNQNVLSFVVNNETERTTLHECHLYKINSGGHGFYRVHYSKEDARKLIKLLNTKHKTVPAVDRANLLSDAFEIARLYPENILTALDFTTYLNHEHHYVPYKIGLMQLNKIAQLLSESKICAKKYIEKKVQPVLDYLNSLQKHNHIQKKLIGLLMNEAAMYDNNVAITLQNMFLHWVISDSSIHLPSHFREVIFKVGVMDGSIYSWNYLFSYYKNHLPTVEKDLVLSGLAATKNKVHLKQLLDYSSKCNEFSVGCIQNKLKVWTKVCENEKGKKIVTDAFLSDWKNLSIRADKIFEYLESFMLSCLGSGKSRTDRKQMEALNDGTLPTHLKTLVQKVIESIRYRINLVQKEKDIEEWFKDNGCSFKHSVHLFLI